MLPASENRWKDGPSTADHMVEDFRLHSLFKREGTGQPGCVKTFRSSCYTPTERLHSKPGSAPPCPCGLKSEQLLNQWLPASSAPSSGQVTEVHELLTGGRGTGCLPCEWKRREGDVSFLERPSGTPTIHRAGMDLKTNPWISWNSRRPTGSSSISRRILSCCGGGTSWMICETGSGSWAIGWQFRSKDP